MANNDPGAPDYQYDWQNPNAKTFDFGRVFGRAFTGIFSNIKSFLIAVVIVMVISIAWSLISSDLTKNLFGNGTAVGVASAIGKPTYWAWIIASSIPSVILTLWLQLVVVKASHAEFTQSPQHASPLTSSLRFVFPMFVVAIIYTIVCVLGWSFLLIGFIFVWPGWALAGPILVHEEKGIFESIGEAWTLSQGSKRWIFLLLFLLFIITLILFFVATYVALLLTGINAFGGNTAAILNISMVQQIIYGLVFGVVSYFTYALFASGLTAAYVEVKTMKGGLGSVGDIFS